MKKLLQSLTSLTSLALLITLLFIPVNAFADSGLHSINGTLLNDQVLFEVDHREVIPVGDDGKEVLPISYNGTTYLPVRAMGYLLGLGIGYEDSTQTVLITSTTDKEPPAPVEKAKSDQLIPIQGAMLNGNLSFKIDGEIAVPLGQDGSPVLPISYNGTTYLPVRALGTLLGIGVDYDNQTNKVLLYKEENMPTASVPDDKDDASASIVMITIPGEFYDGVSVDEISELSKSMGIDKVIVNEDGSYTFYIPKEIHAELIKETIDDINNWKQEVLSMLESVKKVTFNDSYTRMEVIVDEELYFQNVDGIHFLGIAWNVIMYQLYNQVDIDDVQFTSIMIDEKSGEAFDVNELENNY